MSIQLGSERPLSPFPPISEDRVRVIAAAALRWDSTQRERERLTAERGKLECERVTTYAPMDGQYWEVPKPCWKTEEWDYHKNPAEHERWCEPCRQRQTLHRRVLAAGRKAGAHRAALRRMCHRTTEMATKGDGRQPDSHGQKILGEGEQPRA